MDKAVAAGTLSSPLVGSHRVINDVTLAPMAPVLLHEPTSPFFPLRPDQDDNINPDFLTIMPSTSLNRKIHESSQTDLDRMMNFVHNNEEDDDEDYESVKNRKGKPPEKSQPSSKSSSNRSYSNLIEWCQLNLMSSPSKIYLAKSPSPKPIYEYEESDIHVRQYSPDLAVKRLRLEDDEHDFETFRRVTSHDRVRSLGVHEDDEDNIPPLKCSHQLHQLIAHQQTDLSCRRNSDVYSKTPEGANLGGRSHVRVDEDNVFGQTNTTQYDEEDDEENFLPAILQRPVIEPRMRTPPRQQHRLPSPPSTTKRSKPTSSKDIPPPPQPVFATHSTHNRVLTPPSPLRSSSPPASSTLQSPSIESIFANLTRPQHATKTVPTSAATTSKISVSKGKGRAASTGQQPKKRRKMSHLMLQKSVRVANESLSKYIFRLLKTQEGDLSISNQAMNIVDDLMHDVLIRIVNESVQLLKKDNVKTLGVRELKAAVNLVFLGDLAKHAQINGNKAIRKFNANK